MNDPRRYDPRLGDEDLAAVLEQSDHGHLPHRPQKHVRIPDDPGHDPDAPSDDTGTDKSRARPRKKPPEPWHKRLLALLPFDLSWIPANFTRSKIKPAIRCAFVCFVSAILMVIPRVYNLMGQGSFLILISSFLDAPSDPFLAVLERELIFITFVVLAWAWCCLGIFFAGLARTHTDYNAPLTAIQAGDFVEAAPTVILAVFVFLGSAFFLYIKARLGPGPYLFASIFACICIDISMTTAVLFPYPYYLVGQVIALPLAFHCALSIIFSALIFPCTITAQYTHTLFNVFAPLNDFLALHRKVLTLVPASEEFKSTVKTITATLGKSEGGLGQAAANARLLKQDIVYGRFSPSKIGDFQPIVRRLVTRANGMDIFFTLIELTREKFPVTPLPSRPATPRSATPASTRPQTPTSGMTPIPGSPPNGLREDAEQTARRRRNLQRSALEHAHAQHKSSFSRRLHLRLREHHEAHQHHQVHFSLLHLAHALSPLARVPTASSASASGETAVGVFESQRYMAIEATRLSHPDEMDVTAEFVRLLQESCDAVLEATQGAVEKARAERLAKLEAANRGVKEALQRFKKDKRHRVLDPYRSAFDPKHVCALSGIHEPPPHRYLFHCYIYQYHLMRFSSILTEVLDAIIKLEKGYPRAKLWWPGIPIRKMLEWSPWNPSEEMDRADDEDPDIIQGIYPEFNDLGMTRRRDPDALPPSNAFQYVMHVIYEAVTALGRGNALFALKAGLLTVILCIPSFLRGSAAFAYRERFPRPASPDDAHVARGTLTWRLFLAPLCARLCETLYDDDEQQSDLPEIVLGHVGDLKLDGFGARDTVNNMCALLHFLMDRNSPEHTVERSVDSIRMQPSWPDTLRDKPRSHHVEYAWMLFTGLLAVNILSPHLQPTPPPTFAGIVERIFPPLADATAKPLHSSSTARNLLEDGLDIQPTSNVLDHLKLVGNTVSVYMLSAEEIQLLMGYKHNRAARIMHSYVALVEGKLHKYYRLPVSLGIFKIKNDDKRTDPGQYGDLTLISRVIRMYRNDRLGDRTPHLLASRVLTIEGAAWATALVPPSSSCHIWKREQTVP
ncbi:hypothetical protein ACG7TL_004306 [Trametes sanguinea]